MKRIIAIITLLLLTLPVSAETLRHHSGFSFWVPDSWSQHSDSEDDMEVRSPDETAAALFFVLPPDEAEAALDEAAGALDELFPDATIVTEPKETVINGLDGIVFDGRGTSDGVKVNWAMGLINYEDKWVLVLAFCAEDFMDQHKTSMGKILKSLK